MNIHQILPVQLSYILDKPYSLSVYSWEVLQYSHGKKNEDMVKLWDLLVVPNKQNMSNVLQICFEGIA